MAPLESAICLLAGLAAFVDAYDTVNRHSYAITRNSVTSDCVVPGVSSDDGVLLSQTLGDRSYLLWVPASHNVSTDPSPLIISYHGGTKTACDQAQLDLLSSPFFNKEYIVAYPQGIDKKWQGVPGVPVNDTAFTTSLLDTLSASYNIDPSRIFATGKSDGGGFVGVLACDPIFSVRIAAFAPVSGAFYQPNGSTNAAGDSVCRPKSVSVVCNPGRAKVPLIEFHGGVDATIPYAGGARKGECLPGVTHYVRVWAGMVGLDDGRNVSSALTCEATTYRFGSGKELGVVTHVYDGDAIGHSWPATVDNADNLAHGDGPASFNATSVILEFFEKWA